MRSPNLSLIAAIASTMVVLSGQLTDAGDIDPPPGLIGPTMKTLVEVEPRVAVQSLPETATALHIISEPGSYYLTGNINGVTGKNGIMFSTGNFTLDLNGFALLGVSGSLMGIAPVGAPPGNFESITIKNGIVRDWGGGGIVMTDAENTGSGHALVSQVHADANGGYGIRVGQGSQVLGCRASSNTLDGIFIDAGGLVQDCTSARNGGSGFASAERCLIRSCTAHENDGNGFNTGSGCAVVNCVAGTNMGAGINGGQGCVVRNCSVAGNSGGGGIQVGENSTVADCSSISNNWRGISTGAGSTISNCTARDNGNDGIGGQASSVSGCTVSSNTHHGIEMGSDSTITGCTATANGMVGISVANRSLVRDNKCTSNQTGIRATNGENRIEGNNVANNASTGVLVLRGGNFIVKNSVRVGGTTYSISGTNTVGPIITATGTISTTNPWANFEY